MRRRTGALGTLLAIAALASPAVPAHARTDRDCRDFVFQEDAQAVLDADRSDPDRLDEDQGPDDGTACEDLPRRGGTGIIDPVTPAPVSSRPATPAPVTSRPVTPAPVTSRPSTPSPATSGPVTPTPGTTPSQGVRGGLGGSATAGPTGGEIGVGLAFAGGAAFAAGYVLRRRRA
ncbi:excalibur calcium-binding protein [Streptomyces sp. NPDC003456]|uniref:excalibur calcium-binding protein n=1 Tax=Streptomyces sp. NPDC003456 TaxID=3364683 RepID=UPI0036CE157C